MLFCLARPKRGELNDSSRPTWLKNIACTDNQAVTAAKAMAEMTAKEAEIGRLKAVEERGGAQREAQLARETLEVRVGSNTSNRTWIADLLEVIASGLFTSSRLVPLNYSKYMRHRVLACWTKVCQNPAWIHWLLSVELLEG